MPSPEDKLRQQLQKFDAIGQVSTMSREEVLCTGSDPQISLHSTHLASAFVEADQLAKILKLGPLQNVVIGRSLLPKASRVGDDADDPDLDGSTDNSNSNSNSNSNTQSNSNKSTTNSSNESQSGTDNNTDLNSKLRQNEYVVQSKVVAPQKRKPSHSRKAYSSAVILDVDDVASEEYDALVTTTIASNLPAALMGDKAMTATTRRVLS